MFASVRRLLRRFVDRLVRTVLATGRLEVPVPPFPRSLGLGQLVLLVLLKERLLG